MRRQGHDRDVPLQRPARGQPAVRRKTRGGRDVLRDVEHPFVERRRLRRVVVLVVVRIVARGGVRVRDRALAHGLLRQDLRALLLRLRVRHVRQPARVLRLLLRRLADGVFGLSRAGEEYLAGSAGGR